MNGLRRIVQIDLVDLRARRHDRADRPVAEPHDARDHLFLARLQHARVLGFADEVMDLVLRDLLLGLAAAAEQREDQLAGEIEQEDER